MKYDRLLRVDSAYIQAFCSFRVDRHGLFIIQLSVDETLTIDIGPWNSNQ